MLECNAFLHVMQVLLLLQVGDNVFGLPAYNGQTRGMLPEEGIKCYLVNMSLQGTP